MKATYAQYYGGAALINCAATQDNVILYSDLIKVWVDRETLEIIGLDARNYLFSHVERNLGEPSIPLEEAEAKVSPKLEIGSRELALIPITPQTEKLCYEFKCTMGEDSYIIYINAEDGSEEQVFRIIDSEHEINRFLAEDKAILAEGAQGTLLDVDFGSYPFVTSSNTICAGACTGLGIGPNRIGEVYGIFKAYCTRVGSGPFPTELFDETGEALCRLGHEFGAVTGRKRRCGWLDMVALKYAIMVDGVTKLIMMKADVMNDFDTIKVAEAYEIDGRRVMEFPYDIQDDVKPVYREFKGWKTDLKQVRRYEDFPAEFKTYVEYIERETGVPVAIISVGPDRDETIVRQ